MTHRAFRFGTGLFVSSSGREVAESARRIEAQGYSTFVLPDHFHSEGLAPGLTLLAAAEATSSLRVGSLVFDNDFRHPALLAKEAATLDLLTDGRLEFGIGAGWKKKEYDQAGLTFDDAATRVARLEEAVGLIRQLWTGHPVTYAGRFYQVSDLVCYPRPAQEPHPPIFIGGGGRRLLTIAAREANIVGIIARALPGGGLDVTQDTEALLGEKVKWIREAAGERFDQLELQSLIWSVTVADNTATAATTVAQRWGLTPEQVISSPYFLIGSVDTITEALIAQRAKYGISYIVVYPDDRDAFAPVVARLAGT